MPDILDLHISTRRFTNTFSTFAEWHGVTSPDLELLLCIQRGIQTPSAIAEHLDRATPTMSHAVSRMEKQGLIAVTVSPHDKRKRVLTLTDTANGLLTQLGEKWSNIIAGEPIVGSVNRSTKRLLKTLNY